MKRLSHILLLLSFFFFNRTAAQYSSFQNYSLREGLPQSQVFTIFQDQRGSIWIGTNGGGISRFTGKGFETKTRRDGLLSDVIYEITENKNGSLVIKSLLGISIYDGLKFENFPSTNFNFHSSSDLIMDKNGHFWFTANSFQNIPGIYRFDGEKYELISEQFEELAGFDNKNDIGVDSEGNVLISSGNKLYSYSDGKLVPHILQDDPELADKIISNFFLDEKEILWFVALDNKDITLYRYTEKAEIISVPERIDIRRIGPAYADNDGNLWLVNRYAGELYRWNRNPVNEKIETFTDDTGMDISSIQVIYQDAEGNVWFGTNGKGLYKYGGTKFISFQASEGLDNYFIWSIYQDKYKNYWFGTASGGIFKYDGEELVQYPEQEQNFEIVRAIFEFNNTFYIGTSDAGLLSFKEGKFNFANKHFNLPEQSKVSNNLILDNTIWIGTYNFGLFYYDGKQTINYNTTNSNLPSNQIDDIIQDKKGNIWAATRGGLSLIGQDTIKTFQHADYLGFSAIMQLTNDHLGNLWAATYGSGVYKIIVDDNNQLDVIKTDTEKGLSSDNVYSVLTDLEGNIWAGCQNGVDRITLDAEGDIVDIRNYDNYEGFTGFENNSGANFVDNQGKLWFGTINGVMVYNPEMDVLNLTPPRTNITNLQLFYKGINWRDEELTDHYSSIMPWTGLPVDLKLPYNKNHITFEFEGLSYKVPEKVKYQWILEGVDDDWSPPSNRSDAVYANLAPGNYTFMVRSSNNDGIWNEYPARFSFSIKPPFWGTWWFRGAILGFIVAVMIIISWLRNKFIQEKREELEQLVIFKTKKLEEQKKEILNKNEELKGQYHNLELLSKIGRDITANLTIESLLLSIYEKVNNLMDAPVLGFGIFSENKNILDFPFLLKNGKNIGVRSIAFDDPDSLAVKSLRENKEIIIRDIRTDQDGAYKNIEFPFIAEDALSVVFLPLIYNDRPLGVLTVQSFRPGVYNESHLNILRNLATYAKIAIENANAYEKIQKHKKELIKANEDITLQKAEIEINNQKLKELNNEKNNIIGIVAHDLKNPLTSALTMATILKEEGYQLDEDQRHCIEIIQKSMNRMNYMISRLLDIKKIEDNILELKLEKVNLEKLINEVNNSLKNEILRKKIDVFVEAEELYAHVDPDYTVQVFENLISNAIKFSPPERKVKVKLIKSNGKARTEIIDEGPGLTEDDKKRVFGKFQRLSARPTGGEHSTGLGLSIVKKYVEAMNGKVWCESEFGKGANFIVEFTRIE